MLIFSPLSWKGSLILVIYFFHVSADSYPGGGNDCITPWEQLHRNCVQFIKDKPLRTWQESRDYCSNISSNLLSIDSQSENAQIKILIKSHVRNTSFSEWWIGLRQVSGTWKWVGTEEEYAKIPSWASASDSDSREDGNTVREDYCAVIDDKGELKQKHCIKEQRPFICEKLPTFAMSTSLTTEKANTKRKTSQRPTNSVGQENRPTGTPPRVIDHTQPVGPTGRPTGKPKTERPERPTDEPETSNKALNEDEFVGCYAVNYESSCPPLEAFGISWPRTQSGKMATVKCEKGNAKWKCNKKPTCWKEEPDVSKCTSENIQKLYTQANDFLANPEDFEKSMAFTGNLAATANDTEEMSEQDVYETTKLMKEVSKAKPKNSKEAKSLIKNVAMCGSGLVRQDKKKIWSKLTNTSKRNIASSLLNSMESVTNTLMNSFNEPTVESITEDNMEIELQVINVTVMSNTEGTKFESESNRFSIPSELLTRFNTGGLARVVFINYDNVGPLLNPADDEENDDIERSVTSKVVSASFAGVDGKSESKELPEPVTFTFKVGKQDSDQGSNDLLCSFWNFDLRFSGAWSQEGCSLKENNNTHVTCQCNHLTNFAILLDVHSTKVQPVHAVTLTYITYVGIIISIVCLFLTWLTFTCLSIGCIKDRKSSFGHVEGNEYYGQSGSYTGSTAGSRSAQGERNSIHKHLAFCLFIAELLFLCGIERTDNTTACAVIAGFLHYFFLASFTWMFVEGIHILFMLVQVFDAARSRLRYYYAVGYGAPLLVVGISSLVYYEGYGTKKFCWLTTDRMFIWSFAGPVAFILMVNLVILIYAMFTVFKHSDYVFEKDKSAFGSFKAWIQGALAMEVLLGLTWVFGYFYISEEAIPVAYFFTIFNSLQGLFIFIFHCILNKKVRGEYTRFLRVRKFSLGATNSSRGSHPSGSDPRKNSHHINETRKQSEFIDLEKDRRLSARSTTSA